MGSLAVRSLARWSRVVLVMVALAVGTAGQLRAQGTGKIEGKVRDQTGAPIANAQVIIVGTAFATLTNNQGYYFFNNVPVGSVNVRAAFVGYKRSEAQGVRVLAGQTQTVDLQLESVAVEVEAITVTAQTQPLVPRDEVTTKQRIDGAYTNALPLDRLNNAWRCSRAWCRAPAAARCPSAAAGPTRPPPTLTACRPRPGTAAPASGRGWRDINGNGGPGSVRRSVEGITVGVNAFEQASVTTGAASAEFGNAQSGVINIETRSGGSSLKGSVGLASDEPFGAITATASTRSRPAWAAPPGSAT